MSVSVMEQAPPPAIQPAAPLPPGYRFTPTDVELIKWYLTPKLRHWQMNYDMSFIHPVQLYSYSPEQVVAMTAEKEPGEWYVFCEMPKKSKADKGAKTGRAGPGVSRWRATETREIVKEDPDDKDSANIGFRSKFEYRVNGEKTKWLMTEYRVVYSNIVLCKIYISSRQEKKRADNNPVPPPPPPPPAVVDAQNMQELQPFVDITQPNLQEEPLQAPYVQAHHPTYPQEHQYFSPEQDLHGAENAGGMPYMQEQQPFIPSHPVQQEEPVQPSYVPANPAQQLENYFPPQDLYGADMQIMGDTGIYEDYFYGIQNPCPFFLPQNSSLSVHESQNLPPSIYDPDPSLPPLEIVQHNYVFDQEWYIQAASNGDYGGTSVQAMGNGVITGAENGCGGGFSADAPATLAAPLANLPPDDMQAAGNSGYGATLPLSDHFLRTLPFDLTSGQDRAS